MLASFFEKKMKELVEFYFWFLVRLWIQSQRSVFLFTYIACLYVSKDFNLECFIDQFPTLSVS